MSADEESGSEEGGFDTTWTCWEPDCPDPGCPWAGDADEGSKEEPEE